MFSLHRFFIFFLLGVLATLSACDGVKTPTPQFAPTQPPQMASPAPQSFTAPTLISTPTEILTPTPAPPEKSHYSIEAVLDYDQHQLQVSEEIHYINRSSDRLIELVLMVDPLYFPGAFQLNSLAWGDGQPVEDVTQETGWLRFPLRLPLEPDQTIDLSISYQLNLPSPSPSSAVRPIPFGYTARQTNLVDWYPFIPPYVPGKGWLAHPASYYGEHLAYDMSDFSVNIRLSKPNPNLVIAASSPATQDGEWLRYQHTDARNFAWSISPYYQTLTRQAGTVNVTSYAFNGEEKASQAVLDTTVEALELYSRLFGPYPRRALTVVEADFLDGMEYDGLYFLSKGFYNLYTGTPGEYLITIAAHETAHQWWYARVGNDQALEPWLDEALCTYSERLYYENLHPEALDWWWSYRVNYYQPRGWVDDSIYNPHGEPEAYRAYRDAVYLNGAVFLEELRKNVGNQSFFDFFKEYADRYQDHLATKNDFILLIEKFTQVDLTSLLNKYFYKQ
jgi:hypothetical protein